MLKMNLTFNTLQQFLACTKNKDSFQHKKKRKHQSADINCLDVCSFCVLTIVLTLITHSSLSQIDKIGNNGNIGIRGFTT